MNRTMTAVLALVVAAALLTPIASDAQDQSGPLAGKKIAIFLDEHYQIDEAWYTPMRLEEAGAEVSIISHEKEIVSREWHTTKVDMCPMKAREIEWDGIVVIGGFGPLELREDRNVIGIIKDVNDRGGMVSAICHGVCVLVTADIIRGKTITGNVPRSIEFSNAGANYIDEAPQIDGNLITAIGPGDNGPYLDAMIHWFNGGEQAAKANMSEQYLKGKRIAVVIDQRFDYDQAKYPFVRLGHNGADVYYIASADGDYNEYRKGAKIRADFNAQDALNERWDAVILVSHWAADTYRRNADVRQFVTKNLDKGTLIASVNWGHTALIQADACTGWEFAATYGMSNDIKNAGGTPVPVAVHQDRNLITCAKDSDMPALIGTLVENLKK